ncbi:MAG: HAD hydrolase family protein [Peptococcaceae bacterium]|nr:HAD hydrolase family protein [Peptococcaceae bacterium]
MALTHFSCAAFDLDGTLLDGHSQLSPRTKVALDDLHRAGVQVIVCSGRPFSTIPKDILAHPAVRFVATGNGVRIFDKALGKDVYCCALAQQTLEDIVELVQYYPVGYEFFIQGKAFANRAYLADPALYGADLMSNRYLTTTRAPFDDVRSFITAHRNTIDSMGLSLADMVLKKQLWQRLEHEIEGIYVTSSVPRLLEVADARAGKGPAVAAILERLDLDATGLVAFGDADNDLGMIELAGMGVCMENGEAHLKAAADFIAPRHDQDGVAIVLEKLLKEF